jgi:hypothetical protein
MADIAIDQVGQMEFVEPIADIQLIWINIRWRFILITCLAFPVSVDRR